MLSTIVHTFIGYENFEKNSSSDHRSSIVLKIFDVIFNRAAPELLTSCNLNIAFASRSSQHFFAPSAGVQFLRLVNSEDESQ